jgi:hypothetical protein
MRVDRTLTDSADALMMLLLPLSLRYSACFDWLDSNSATGARVLDQYATAEHHPCMNISIGASSIFGRKTW